MSQIECNSVQSALSLKNQSIYKPNSQSLVDNNVDIDTVSIKTVKIPKVVRAFHYEKPKDFTEDDEFKMLEKTKEKQK